MGLFPKNYANGYGNYENEHEQAIPEFEIPNTSSQKEGDVTVENLSTLHEKNYVVFLNAEAIDAIVKQDTMILALQITTNKSKDKLKKKFVKLNKYCRKLEHDAQKLGLEFTIIPWFISLEEFCMGDLGKDNNGLISTASLWDMLF